QIEVADLGPEVEALPNTGDGTDEWFPDEGIDLERYMEGIELTLIKRSLERTQGNKVRAARLLNLKRTTLIEKLKRLERQPGLGAMPPRHAYWTIIFGNQPTAFRSATSDELLPTL